MAHFYDPAKRPDFVLSSQEGVAQIIEIKKPDHTLKNEEMARIIRYHNYMKSFLDAEENAKLREFFHDFHITLVCDHLRLTEAHETSYQHYVQTKKLTRVSWMDFLLRTETVHRDFLAEAERQRALVSSRRRR